METRVFLSFEVADRKLALPLKDIARVVALPLLAPPVAAPAFVEGFFDLQGSPVAVLRLDRLLELGEEALGLYTPLLVLKGANPPLALHVARVDAVLKVLAGDVQPIGEGETLSGCVVGRVGRGGETIYLLSSADVLLTAEREKLAAHCLLRQRRLDALERETGHAC